MRRTFSAILILFVFLSLQFGKVATYLYCKWQAEVVQNKPDCGCNEHLLTMFDHNEPTENGSLAKNTIQEKITEYSQKLFTVDLSLAAQLEKNCFAEYDSALPKNFIAAPFHPPAV